ncbi:amidohydrolase family protein [Desulfosoma caldarium]|uniref:Amidohydrolase family protein n=1 Tax=Desulfosoma caldarium TaxID=610254 RepID=A0A3N1UUB3_9BACT|nr:amidohydrolase family protein [Desulfosoma caldarium]ROQ92310.1 amidohydrolase family protein [Desulfosoma caldarium]
MKTRILQSGTVYDIALGCEGKIQDIALCGDRIIPLDQVSHVDEVVDASGLVVTAAALDCAAHVAFPGVWSLRARGLFPDAETLALRYAQRGFGHVHESWVTVEHAGLAHNAWAQLSPLNVSIGLCLPLYDLTPWIEAQDAQSVGRAMDHVCRALGLRGLYLPEPRLRFRNEVYKHREKSAKELLPFLRIACASLSGPFMMPAKALLEEEADITISGFHGQRIAACLDQEHLSASETVSRLVQSGMQGDLGLSWPEKGVQLTWGDEFSGIQGFVWDVGTFVFLQAKPLPEKDFQSDEVALALMAHAMEKGWAFSCRQANLALVQDWKALVHAVLKCWTVREWLAATRVHAAKALGLADRGHLCPGAQADVALYPQPEDDTPAGWAQTFSQCQRLYVKGRLVYDASLGHRMLRSELESKKGPEQTEMDQGLLHPIFEGLSLRPQTLIRLVARHGS